LDTPHSEKGKVMLCVFCPRGHPNIGDRFRLRPGTIPASWGDPVVVINGGGPGEYHVAINPRLDERGHEIADAQFWVRETELMPESGATSD